MGRRLRILPQPSSPPVGGLTYYDSSRSKASTNHMTMHTKCKRLTVYDAFVRYNKPTFHSSEHSRWISINCDAFNEWESLNYPREYPDFLHQSLFKGSPLSRPRNSNRIHLYNQRIVPSLIRLADDLAGKEAGQEANIGDKKNVTKHIN